MSRRLLRTAALTALVALAAAAPAAAHGDPQPRAPAGAAALQLRGCLMTVALVPRPASVLRKALPSPPDLTRTFYGPDPLLAVWGLSCDGARVAGAPAAGRVVLSALVVPTALTDPRAVPLANNFAHRLVRIDTGSRVLAAALRHRGLPARLAAARATRTPRGKPSPRPQTSSSPASTGCGRTLSPSTSPMTTSTASSIATARAA